MSFFGTRFYVKARSVLNFLSSLISIIRLSFLNSFQTIFFVLEPEVPNQKMTYFLDNTKYLNPNIKFLVVDVSYHHSSKCYFIYSC